MHDDIIARGRSILAQDQAAAWESFIAQARGVALSTQLARWIDAWRNRKQRLFRCDEEAGELNVGAQPES